MKKRERERERKKGREEKKIKKNKYGRKQEKDTKNLGKKENYITISRTKRKINRKKEKSN